MQRHDQPLLVPSFQVEICYNFQCNFLQWVLWDLTIIFNWIIVRELIVKDPLMYNSASLVPSKYFDKYAPRSTAHFYISVRRPCRSIVDLFRKWILLNAMGLIRCSSTNWQIFMTSSREHCAYTQPRVEVHTLPNVSEYMWTVRENFSTSSTPPPNN